MKLWGKGFFMAWGMFLSIPCPVKKWDENAKAHMLAFFPVMGIAVGLIWAAVHKLLLFVGAGEALYALGMCAVPFFASGLLHLDGFMDVCDAIFSRRELSEKRRILKDPHCGAFAVICAIFLLMAYFCFFIEGRNFIGGRIFIDGRNPDMFSLVLVSVAVRGAAAAAAGSISPMEGSGYAGLEREKKTRLILPVVLAALSSVSGIVSGGISGFAPLSAVCGYALAVIFAAKELGGFSGDVSGFALVIGELCGVGFAVLGGVA